MHVTTTYVVVVIFIYGSWNSSVRLLAGGNRVRILARARDSVFQNVYTDSGTIRSFIKEVSVFFPGGLAADA
jgi:hypothetical protein